MHRAASSKGHRGDARLLHHLGTLDRALGPRRRSAHARLEAKIGPELARTLTTLLASPASRLSRAA
jgi:hypothetical protein